MAIQRTLEMDFATELGRTHRMRVYDIRADVTATNINNTMDSIIAKNIFETKTGNLNGKVGARVISRDVANFDLA
ncbi:MAG: DUF2922 domain-containing protein [Syntrophomonadaceae bacterium]|jgi:hypothetical protein|nr:DUF2922 domain-containing protein [Syntrophomonadaceae bacterium]